MQIQMTQTTRGSQDGFTIERFHEGQTYDVRHGLASQFIARKQAVQVNALTTEEEVDKLMALLTEQRNDRLNATQL